MKNIAIYWLFIFLFITTTAFTQKNCDFIILNQVKTSAVKNQDKTNTCWSFTVLAMLESELLQQGKDEISLSEMFIVHQAYKEKAEKYIRMHGSVNLTSGGELNDAIDVIKKYGIVPTQVYNGLKQGFKEYDHTEMDLAIKTYLAKVLSDCKTTICDSWKAGLDSILDYYLGIIPTTFIYNNKSFTPISFVQSLELNLDDYILFTSFTHHPYYQRFVLEVPDNWSWEQPYNVTLSDLETIIDFSLKNNHSVAWMGDISEKGFRWKKGIAWVKDTSLNKTDLQNYVEPDITGEIRQKAFDNYSTTDDHGMVILGNAYGENKKSFYYVKNSWGTENTAYNGFLYMSKAYLQYKTISIMVNKKVVPQDILLKLTK